MTEESKRRGGWPGPRKPSWSFRPTSEAEAAVDAYLKAHGLNPERDRSRAINALLELTAAGEHSHDWDCCQAPEGECCEHCFA